MFAERVLQGAVAPGSATTINLTPPPSGWRSFVAAFGTGQPCYYYIEDETTDTWEAGSGSVTAGSPDTLTRTKVLLNSLGTTARINFSGTVQVYNDLLAPTAIGRAVFLAATAAAARAALDAEAVAVNTGGVIGQRVTLTSGVGNALVLPAGGQWDAFVLGINASGQITSHLAAVSAGGSTFAAATPGINYIGLAKRVA